MTCVHAFSYSEPQRPVIKQLVHLSLSSLSVLWAKPSSVTDAQILYYDANGITNTTTILSGSTTSFVLENLQSGLTYSISLQSLSVHLPSAITDPITTTIGEFKCIHIMLIINVW